MKIVKKYKALLLSSCVVIGLLALQADFLATGMARNRIAIQAVRVHYEEPGEPARATVWSPEVLNQTSTDLPTHRLLSHIYLYIHQVHNAAYVLRGNESVCPDVMTCYLQGQIHYASGHTEQAINTWRSIANTDQYFAFQGDVAFEQDDKIEALRLYELSWRIADTPTPNKTTMLLNLCREHRSTQDMTLAIYWCQQAVASRDNYWTELELGRTYHEAQQYDLSEQTLRRAIHLAPNQGSAYHWLGLTLSRSGRPRESLEALYNSIRLDPRNSWVHIDLADNLASMGEFGKAACEYIKARDLTNQANLLQKIQERIVALPLEDDDLRQCSD